MSTPIEHNTDELRSVLQQVNELPDAGSGLDTSDATAVAGNIDFGETAYANGVKLVGSKRRKEYTGEIVSTVLGSGKFVVLAQDDFLAEHRNDETLFVRVDFDVERAPYTVVKTWGRGKPGIIPVSSDTMQLILRYDVNGNDNTAINEYAITDSTTATSGVGRMYITEDGELRIYSNSSANYAIRPSKYKAVIEW